MVFGVKENLHTRDIWLQETLTNYIYGSFIIFWVWQILPNCVGKNANNDSSEFIVPFNHASKWKFSLCILHYVHTRFVLRNVFLFTTMIIIIDTWDRWVLAIHINCFVNSSVNTTWIQSMHMQVILQPCPHSTLFIQHIQQIASLNKKMLHKNGVEMQWNHLVDSVVWLAEGCWCTKPLWHCQQQGGDCLILKQNLLFLSVMAGSRSLWGTDLHKNSEHCDSTHTYQQQHTYSKLKVSLTEMHQPLRSPHESPPSNAK